MTGFGKASGTYGNKKITVEIKSVNSKQLDLNIRIPSAFRDKEMELKNFVAQKAERGKTDVSIYYENLGEDKVFSLNKEVAKAYINEIKSLGNELGITVTEQTLAAVLRMPEVVSTEKKEADENEWNTIMTLVDAALDAFIEFRMAEGGKLETDLKQRIASILDCLKKTEPYDQQRIQTVRDKIQKSLNEWLQQENIDKNRFEQELIYYIEKLDVSEEKLRLKTHCDYFTDTMEKENNSGRKLGFITQEIGREINTLGSKANQAEMQKLVVLMKDELEKVKEQVLNIL